MFTRFSHQVTTAATSAALLAVVIAAFLVVGYQAARSDAPTYDEPLYVASGLLALDRGDLWINDEHPPIAKVLAALPALLAGARLPTGRAPDEHQEHAYTAAFVREQSADHTLKSVTFDSRLVPLAITISVALALALLAASLFGLTAGLLAAAVWLASPLVLGLGHLDGVDVPFTGAVLLFSLMLLRWLREPAERRRLIALALAGGLAALTDVDGLLLVALAGVLVLRNTRSDRRRTISTLAAGVIITIWLPYVLIALVSLHPAALSPLPYLEGLKFAFGHNSGSAPSYLLGHAWTGSYLPFWPGSLLLKLPLPTLLLLLVTPIACWRLPAGTRRELLLAVLLPALLILLFDLPQPRDIGIRYLLPVIALWTVGAAALAAPALRRTRLAAAALALAAVFGLVTMIGARHDALAWTDPIFGPGYQVATNSNLDWGQGLYALRQWTDHHPGARVEYFGTPGLTVAGSRPLDGVAPDTISGWAAASATALTTYSDLAWLRAYCPVAELDDTILLYRFASPPTAAPGGAEPPALCPGSASHRV